MQYRTLGRTGLKVSLLSQGTGGPSQFGQKAGLLQAEQNRLIRRCLDLGINLFDTHESYGDSEVILGRALKGIPRDDYILVTKWAYPRDGAPTGDPEELTRSVERSLRHLNTDHIDVMMFHGLLAEHHDMVVERYMPVLERLRERGLVGHRGFSLRYIVDPAQCGATAGLTKAPGLWDVIMLKYGILNQYAAKEMLPLALEHNIGILNMAAVRIKLPNPKLLQETIAGWKSRGLVPQDALPDKDPLGWLVHDDVESVIAAAYKFAADHPAISSVITGTSNLAHLESNVRAMRNPALDPSDSARLKRLFGHIVEYA
jgi:L-galactose dehydrogenase